MIYHWYYLFHFNINDGNFTPVHNLNDFFPDDLSQANYIFDDLSPGPVRKIGLPT